jgi:hypothetical protein
MPRLNLAFLRRDSQQVGPRVVYYERIKALISIGTTGNLYQDCIVDTGSMLPMFAQIKWQKFQSEINWIYTPGNCPNLPEWLAKATGIGGTSFPCGLGLVKIQIVEVPSFNATPVLEILAKFPLDQGVYSQNLLGLGGNTFSNWKFGLDYSNQRAWLDY